MPGINLTREEAALRASLLSVESYDVILDLTTSPETFLAKTTVVFACTTPGAATFIDVVAKKLIKAELNGVVIDASKFDGETLFLDNLAAANTLVVEVDARFMNTGEGLHRFTDPADNEVYLYTQFETADARRMYACFDQPDLKATFTLTATAPAHWELISNNPVASRTDLGAEKNMWVFATTPRVSTYITALVAGPYSHVHDSYSGAHGEVPLGIYCRKSLAPFLDPEELFDLTKRGFAFFEEEFGLAYPFAKYDQIAVAEFNAGAMENAGCVTFNEDSFVFRSKAAEEEYNWRANTILHEMAHMWFGDLVTMRWWDDLWLNESFAEWASYTALAKATRFSNSWAAFNTERKNWAYRQDQLSSTHPVATDMSDMEAVRANFDGISYAKGASVLRQLVVYIGEENFVAALKVYFAKHAWQNTTLNDLLVELEATSGRTLGPWVETWLKTAGVNTLRPRITLDGEKYAQVVIEQNAPTMPEGSTEIRPHRLAVGLYDIQGSALVRRSSHELDVVGSETVVADLAGLPKADVLLINDLDYSYAKIRFDADSLKALVSHIDQFGDPLTQSLAWAAAWDMIRDGELAATAFLALGLQALRGNSSLVLVARTVTTHLSTAVELYSGPANRDALRITLANGLNELMASAQPGSGEQLSFARAFVNAAANSPSLAHHTQLKSMLDGAVEGLIIDTDLRWLIVGCLAQVNLLSESAINEELERDNTADGHRSATFALAARPDANSKRAVWDRIISGTEANHTNDALIAGFRRPSQRDLLSPYVDEYFAIIEEIWGRVTYEISSTIVNLTFPIYETTAATLTKCEKWLSDHSDAAPGLRRYVAENRDALSRALIAQKCDAS
ncbi:MAG: aminopeptidase N [Actinomycetes bacterium]